MSETPYYDAYMKGERSNNFFYKQILKQLDNELDNELVNEWYIRTNFITDRDYFEEDWRYDD